MLLMSFIKRARHNADKHSCLCYLPNCGGVQLPNYGGVQQHRRQHLHDEQCQCSPIFLCIVYKIIIKSNKSFSKEKQMAHERLVFFRHTDKEKKTS